MIHPGVKLILKGARTVALWLFAAIGILALAHAMVIAWLFGELN